ncbi:MAG: hypothetical protein ACKN9U_21275 [Pirellulaceae bacterium]
MPTDVRRWTQENRTARAAPLQLRCLLHCTLMQQFVARSIAPKYCWIDQISGLRDRFVSESFAITQTVECLDGPLEVDRGAGMESGRAAYLKKALFRHPCELTRMADANAPRYNALHPSHRTRRTVIIVR